MKILFFLLVQWALSCDAIALSPPEQFLLSSRLSSIQDATKQEAQRLLGALQNEDATIIFPGSGGRDGLTDELEARISNESSPTRTWDWIQHRGSLATASFDGEAVGEALAAFYKDCRSVHIIGVSVGGFCANQMATVLYQMSSGRPQIRLTLLDPFCSRGILGIGYGKANFGVNADYAEHFLNSDDPVPSTNDPLPNCYCIDVTRAPERRVFQLPEGESMHCWPLAYYSRYGYLYERDKNGKRLLPSHDETRRRGKVERL